MRLDRRAKIKLLLTTLLDATSASRGSSDIRAAFGSKPPAKSEELWAAGSYADLWRCLDDMKMRYPKIHRHTVAHFTGHAFTRQRVDGSLELFAPRKSVAEKGVDLLARRMPRDVFVPQEVSENAGFLPSDAKIAAMPR